MNQRMWKVILRYGLVVEFTTGTITTTHVASRPESRRGDYQPDTFGRGLRYDTDNMDAPVVLAKGAGIHGGKDQTNCTPCRCPHS